MASTTIEHFSGSTPTLDLVYSDVWLPPLYCRRILCFQLPEGSSHERALDCLKRGLQPLVDGTPELGGQVVVLPARNAESVPWKGFKAYKGATLVIKDLRHNFPAFAELEANGFPIAEFKDRLLVPVPVEIQPDPNPEMVVQATLIEGGLLLTVCLLHNLTDGNGMNAIMIALGEQCKLAAEVEGPLEPRVMQTDRRPMLDLTGSKTSLDDHPAYSYAKGAFAPHVAPSDTENKQENGATLEETPLAEGHDEAQHAAAFPKVHTHTYRISPAAASALKSAATTESRVSTHDAVAALMWRTLILARHKAGRLTADKTSTYSFPHNARRYVEFPKDWVGNCCYLVSASVPVARILEPNSLPILASAIRAALNAVNKDVVGGLMELRKPCTYDIAWWPFSEVHEPWILMMTSFYHSELYGTDWGASLGNVKHFTTSDEGAFGGYRSSGFVGPRLPGEGCDVSLGLDEEEEAFVSGDELWREYVQEMRGQEV